MKRNPTLKMLCAILAALFCSITASGLRADISASLDIDVSKPGPAIPKTFYGLMTEEINHAYDGGLFAELIQNRTFQDPSPARRGRGGATQPSPAPVASTWSASIPLRSTTWIPQPCAA